MSQILVLNLGSTSSKVAIYTDAYCKYNDTIRHDLEITSLNLIEQIKHRRFEIERFVKKVADVKFSDFDGIACRGGLLKPISGGVYAINEMMYNDLRTFKYGDHASNLSGIIGYELSRDLLIPVFTIDSVVVDELMDIARVTGIKGIKRRCIFHALNQKAVASLYANSSGRTYKQVNVIVAHMGGGITIGAHRQGLVVDVNEGLLGEGPFSPERAGSIPNDLLYEYGYTNNFTPQEMNRFLSKECGFVNMFKTNDTKVLSLQYESDSDVKLAFDALAYQVAKAIGERAIVFKGNVDQVILTGGLGYNKILTSLIQSYVDWIAPVTIYPGEKEMDALATRTSLVLKGKEIAKVYS